MREGDWVLLDEINLASYETLTCVLAVIDAVAKGQSSIYLPHLFNYLNINLNKVIFE